MWEVLFINYFYLPQTTILFLKIVFVIILFAKSNHIFHFQFVSFCSQCFLLCFAKLQLLLQIHPKSFFSSLLSIYFLIQVNLFNPAILQLIQTNFRVFIVFLIYRFHAITYSFDYVIIQAYFISICLKCFDFPQLKFAYLLRAYLTIFMYFQLGCLDLNSSIFNFQPPIFARLVIFTNYWLLLLNLDFIN